MYIDINTHEAFVWALFVCVCVCVCVFTFFLPVVATYQLGKPSDDSVRCISVFLAWITPSLCGQFFVVYSETTTWYLLRGGHSN